MNLQGTLEDGREVAVKRLSGRSGQGGNEFKNEVMVVARFQHRNLARLLGFCVEGEERALIYEYTPNKSLDFFLYDHTKQTKKWIEREGMRLQLVLLEDFCIFMKILDLKLSIGTSKLAIFSNSWEEASKNCRF